jgi:chorismate dehydratase
MLHDMPRCGRISYTNDLPVYAAIDESVLSFPGTMIADVPARLNQALLEGELDISPISSAFYAQHADKLVLLPDICIGAYAKVLSICCISAVAPSALAARTIAVTRESVTGRMLFQLICLRHFGFDPLVVESDDPFALHLADGTPCLLIGDKAIDAAEQVPLGSVHDLGELWHRLSGSGMVYAVWAARNDYAATAPEQVRAASLALHDSLEWGLENIHRVISRAEAIRPRQAGFYEEYYHALRFHFDDESRSALVRFMQAAHEMSLLEGVPALRFFDAVAQHA